MLCNYIAVFVVLLQLGLLALMKFLDKSQISKEMFFNGSFFYAAAKLEYRLIRSGRSLIFAFFD